MQDKWINDCMLAYIEVDIFNGTDNVKIMKCFQNMKNHRGQLYIVCFKVEMTFNERNVC